MERGQIPQFLWANMRFFEFKAPTLASQRCSNFPWNENIHWAMANFWWMKFAKQSINQHRYTSKNFTGPLKERLPFASFFVTPKPGCNCSSHLYATLDPYKTFMCPEAAHRGWRMGSQWMEKVGLITMVIVFRPLKDRNLPLPNGRTSWLINGGDPNHLHPLGWSSKWEGAIVPFL